MFTFALRDTLEIERESKVKSNDKKNLKKLCDDL
jgi:hypothetical protein